MIQVFVSNCVWKKNVAGEKENVDSENVIHNTNNDFAYVSLEMKHEVHEKEFSN